MPSFRPRAGRSGHLIRLRRRGSRAGSDASDTHQRLLHPKMPTPPRVQPSFAELVDVKTAASRPCENGAYQVRSTTGRRIALLPIAFGRPNPPAIPAPFAASIDPLAASHAASLRARSENGLLVSRKHSGLFDSILGDAAVARPRLAA